MIHNLPHLTQKDGSLYIEDINVNDLAEQYGTPLYVYSKNRILENYHRMKEAFEEAGIKIKVHYAVKTNSNLSILHTLREAGAGADVASITEIKLAQHAGFKSEDIIYSGNNNPNEELNYSLKYVDKINLDDISILPRLLQFGKPKILSFRINPGVGKGSKGIATNVFGGKDSKFGVDPETALYAYQMAKKEGVEKFGIHMMPGSGGLDPDFYPTVTKKLFEIAEMIATKADIKFEFINIGGGFGIPYNHSTEKALNIEAIAKEIAEIYKDAIKNGNVGNPQLECEPGRYIVGDAGLLLARVHTIKNSYKRFAGTDVGMNTLVRPALHGSYHAVVVANKMAQKKVQEYTFCGPICENTDQYKEPRKFPILEEGDLLSIFDTGAYGFTMASTFNNQPRPAEVMVNGSNHSLIRKRETSEDLIRPMIVPQI